MSASRTPLPLRRLRLLAAATAALLLLAACGGGGEAKKSDAVDDGPLMKYLNAIYEAEGDSEKAMQERGEREQEIIATCMKEEGFEYTPVKVDYGQDELSMSGSDEDGPEWGSLEFAEQYGFGIVSWPGSEEEESEAEAGGEEETEEEPDPNYDYYSSLSESEQAAYDQAMYGSSAFEEPEVTYDENGEEVYEEPEEISMEEQGCTGKAMAEVWKSGLEDDPQYKELEKALDEFWGEDSEIPGQAELDEEWAACMEKAGFAEYARDGRWAVSDPLNDEYYQMQGGDSDEWIELTDAQNEEFQKREIEVAVADAKCGEKVDYDTRLTKADHKREQEFVDQHKDLLESLLAKSKKLR